MSSKPFKAFVSSTFEDLKDHRAYVIRSLRKAGIMVDPMEEWTAESDEPKQFSQERLDGCDFCVLLVALRRGYVPKGETRSITQLEYEAALDAGIDVLVYLLDENAPWPHRFVELDKGPGHLGVAPQPGRAARQRALRSRSVHDRDCPGDHALGGKAVSEGDPGWR